MYYSGEIKIFN